MLDKSPKMAPASGSCKVSINSKAGGTAFDMPKDDLMLMGALEEGLNWPHSCRVGTCGRCKTKLVKGKISPLVDFALSPLTNRDLKAGYVLACQSKVRTDVEVEVELIDHGIILPRSIPGIISSWKKLPGDVIDLRIKLEAPLVFEAGQYAALAASGSFIRRSFSFYDAPPGPEGTHEVGFLVRHLPGGRFSGWLAEKDRTGIRMWVEAPFGQMGLDDTPRDALCIAGGTGIAPILSITADRLKRFPQSRVTIVFGVRRQSDLFGLDRLNALEASGQVRVIPILSDEPRITNWEGERGLVTAVLGEALDVAFGDVSAFICGALPMVEAVEERLLALGCDAGRIHADKFVPSGL